MSDHVYRKFPVQIAAIRALKNTDPAFGEICDDYEEMCTWLAAQSRPIDTVSKEFIDARKIISDLEDEIIERENPALFILCNRGLHYSHVR